MIETKSKIKAEEIEAVDVLIVGGGLTGMALMHALAPLGYAVRLVEAHAIKPKAQGILDTRSIALSPASMRILKQLHIWPELLHTASSIQSIHISEQGRLGQGRLHADAGKEPLGSVVEMHALMDALKAKLNSGDIFSPARVVALNSRTGIAQLATDAGDKTVQAQWIVAADGTESSIRALCHATARTKLYQEHAIAANIALSRPHGQVAYERFTTQGPLALLPLHGAHMALVWTLNPEQVKQLKTMDEAAFLHALQRAFGYRAGRFLAVGPRAIYPLKQLIMPTQVCNQVVFVGNAAHTLHPVAGQGFNLGLRDIAMLAECAAKHGVTRDALNHYQQLRKTDQAIITTATDGLISLFKSRLPGVGLARRMGLIALDNSDLLKNILLRHAKGFGGVVPDLVCGTPLDSTHKVF
ncbi:MAG: FAD-dependent monooxygenase [Gammaproteobacteria bacterium]|nr:FAD-dependent monooxygenase [Gammaproteobacteria bacterium]MCH9715919.1 FAD-dependent monooxygenase [Gammaproteobacteria bacterium]MCH9762823.1 FAD-dependent monooxygenase [Gammaproteobacteria bacterium]